MYIELVIRNLDHAGTYDHIGKIKLCSEIKPIQVFKFTKQSHI